MVFGGGQLSTLKLFFRQIFYFFLSRSIKNVFFMISRFFKHTLLLIMSIKDILNSKTFKNPRFKKVFLDENL